MKRFFLCIALCIFSIFSNAQVQFVAVGKNNSGGSPSIVSFKSDGTTALLHDFKISDPTYCQGITEGPDGKLYGTTTDGGSDNNGVIFSINLDGTNFKVIFNYATSSKRPHPSFGPDGKLYITISDSLYSMLPDGSSVKNIAVVGKGCKEIVVSNDSWVYGCGSENNSRFIFRIKTDGSGYTVLHAFNRLTEGNLDVSNTTVCITPTGRVFLTCSGSVNNKGTLISIRTDGSDFRIEKTFTSAEETIYGTSPITTGAVFHNNGKILFNMLVGGSNRGGTILSFDTLTSTLSTILSFPTVAYSTSNATQVQTANGKLVGINSQGLYSVNEDGTNFQQLNTLPASGAPILNYNVSTNKILYTATGGSYKNSSIIKVDFANNTNINIHNFGNVPDGYNPDGIIKAPNGLLYGITQNGGATGGGTLYKMNTDGSGFKTILGFAGDNGQSPFGQLFYASDGRLYGICKKSGIGGLSDSMLIYGVNADGTNYSVLHIFSASADGNLIPELTEGSGGQLFGIIGPSGFPPPCKIFKINKNGTGYTVLKTLSSTGMDGYMPTHGLVYYDGYVYGITAYGGNAGSAEGVLFRVQEDGSNYSVVKYFDWGTSDGSDPEGGLILASNNILYGYTLRDGANNAGTLFAVDPEDLSFYNIHDFDYPIGSPVRGKITQASNGKLYMKMLTGILEINLNGSKAALIESSNYDVYSIGNNCYLTEIPLPVTTLLCPSIASTLIKSDLTGASYQWQLNTGNGFVNINDNSNYTGTHNESLQLSNIPSSFTGYEFRCLVDNGTSAISKLKFTSNWTGAVNTAWENVSNWSCAELPDANTDVVISGSSTIVVNSNVTIKSLRVGPGASISVAPGYTLTILK